MTIRQTIDRLTDTDRAVSPVIGVILMVAITVILAAVIGTFVLDLGQSAGDSAPSASLDVDVDTGSDVVVVDHKGGDGLDAAQTRVIITNESTDETATYEPAGDSDVLSVGGNVSFDPANGAMDSSKWTDLDIDSTDFSTSNELNSGHQYSVQLIDTESQRVIYETTVTA